MFHFALFRGTNKLCVHLEKKKVLLASMKVKFPLSALIFFLFLAYLTHPGKRDETPQSAEKQDFFFNDYIHGTTITGSWIDKNYVVKMEINSIRLDVKLVFKFTENMNPADINSSPDGHWTPKHVKIHKFKESPKYPRNASSQDFEVFRPRNPGLISWTTMTVVWNRCSDVTVAIASRGWDGVTWLAEWIWDKATSLTDGIWNGGSWMTERVWNGATWLNDGVWNGITWLADVTWNGVIWAADGAWNGVTWLADGVWNGVIWTADGVWNEVTWLAEWIWNGVTRLNEWTWNRVAWLAEWIWNGFTWTGSLFLPGNYVTDCLVNLYYGYLDSHVNYIDARIAASTWQDVFLMTSVVFVVNFVLLFIYLLVTCTVNFIRRLWKARKNRITAANLALTPKKPIWRPKPKKKRRRNRNGW